MVRIWLQSIICYVTLVIIRPSVCSFVNQKTDFGYEVLINDDASGDKTAEIIREYEEKYPHIIRPFYQKENQFSKGIGYVYENVLYPNARGKYLAFCEGDDCWTDNTKLQQQADFMETHPDYAACVHNTLLHYCDGSRPDEALIAPAGDRDLGFEQLIQGPVASYHTSYLFARKDIITQQRQYYWDMLSAKGMETYRKEVDVLFQNYWDDVMKVYSTDELPMVQEQKALDVNSQYSEKLMGLLEEARDMEEMLYDKHQKAVEEEEYDLDLDDLLNDGSQVPGN